eukprot:14609963-Heterocapsa_arctica.AAC.1
MAQYNNHEQHVVSMADRTSRALGMNTRQSVSIAGILNNLTLAVVYFRVPGHSFGCYGFKTLEAAFYQSSNQTKKSGRPALIKWSSSGRHVPGK